MRLEESLETCPWATLPEGRPSLIFLDAEVRRLAPGFGILDLVERVGAGMGSGAATGPGGASNSSTV